MTLRQHLFPLALLAFTACVLPAPEDLQEEQAAFTRDFAQRVRASTPTLSGPPPRPLEEMRAAAHTQFTALEGLRDEALQRLAQLQRNPNAGGDDRRFAKNAAARIRMDRTGLSLQIDQADLASHDWRAIRRATTRFTHEAENLHQRLADTNRRLRQLAGHDPSSSPLPAISPAEQQLTDAIEEARAQGTAVLTEAETLHDELIRLLEAVATAHADSLDQKAAQGRLALARLAKRHDLARWKDDLAGADLWRIEAGRAGAERSKHTLARQIADAQATLRRLRP